MANRTGTGLTEDHPELTTYFEGEIIGPKYSFHTQHEDWGASEKVDLQHWSKFSEFDEFKKQAKAKNTKLHLTHVAQRKTIFMRWKEHFLVPDHRIKALSGASFEGFYYICFNQLEGKVSGIYFHAKSEKYVYRMVIILRLFANVTCKISTVDTISC